MISYLNLADPVTLVRSPILTKIAVRWVVIKIPFFQSSLP
jgi:hypothetical protein